ncbi:MAG: LysR family transcriptional regulator [Marinibacterium sp.]
MKSWDDQRYALAIARAGSVTGAARDLGVNRSTVLRRLDAFEAALGVRLFDRRPQGYFATPAGESLVAIAARMEDLTHEIDRRIAGQDTGLRGPIRVAMTPALATYVLMPDLARFARDNPDIRLDLLTSYVLSDLDRREADVALRIANDPPEDLVGRRVARVAHAVYAGREHCGDGPPRAWVTWSPHWQPPADRAGLPVRAVVTDPAVTVRALQEGMGMSVLPCFIGDAEPGLARVEGITAGRSADLWILTHRDLRGSARIRIFMDYIADCLVRARPTLEAKGGV